MKISESALMFKSQHSESQSLARVLTSDVRMQSNSSSSGTSGVSIQASIIQSQQQTLKDTISSNSFSHIQNSDGDEQVMQNSAFLESITQVSLTEAITVSAVNLLGQAPTNGQALNQTFTEVQVTRVMAFEAQSEQQVQTIGKVLTEDGREIDFMLEVNYQREIDAIQTSQFRGERNLIDPLVINLNGGTAELSDLYFEFDLNSDGEIETLHQTATGTGFLAFDKNQNGKIDDGSELFGPNSQNGFGELSHYDSDKNGWIDENDAIYSQLSFMDFDGNGQQHLRSIGEVKIGAIALESRELDFDLYDTQGNFQAQVARTGVALSESGHVLSMQEIYFAEQSFGQGRLERIQNIDLNGSDQTVSISSPLTQFQFDNETLNARVAKTHVKLDLPSYSNRAGLDHFNEFNTGLGASRNSSNNSESGNPEIPASSQQRQSPIPDDAIKQKEAIQAEFRNRMETEYKNIAEFNHESKGTSDFQYVEIATQSQSVFWQHEGSNVSESSEDLKIAELKALIENLKSIRENQVKMQGKLGIYINIDTDT